MSRVIEGFSLMTLTLQNTHDTHKDTIVQNMLIDGMIIEKHFRGVTTVSHVKCTWEQAYEWFACTGIGRGGHSGSQDPRIS